MAADEQGKRRPTKASVAQSAPWLPPAYDPADAAAVQAVAEGRANELQQRRAITWIIEAAADLYGMSYRPGGQDGERDTAFAEGRRFVGNQIVKLTKISLAKIARQQ